MVAEILFAFASTYAAYVIVGYPLLLAYLAGVRPQKVFRRPYTPSVSIIIATHNGAAFLRNKLDSIFALDYPRELLQVIVVSDGSTDNTREIAASYGDAVVFIDSKKLGKAAAVNQGMAAATGQIFVFTDVRQLVAPDSLRFLVENFSDPKVGVVSAELQIEAGLLQCEADVGAYWKYERWIRLNLSTLDSIFGATGSYYAVRRELAVPIPANVLVDDMYLPLGAFFKGYRLIVDQRAKMYDYPTNLAIEFGRKVRTLAGNYQILAAYPQLLGPKNRLLAHFLPYKLGRLLLPFALLTAAISSLCVSDNLRLASACVQCVMYLAAAVDLWVPASARLKRITSPVRSFLVMMGATICAICIWFVPAERLWKPTQLSRPAALP